MVYICLRCLIIAVPYKGIIINSLGIDIVQKYMPSCNRNANGCKSRCILFEPRLNRVKLFVKLFNVFL